MLCVLFLFSNVAFADFAIIVHPSNESSFDESVISRIYTGKEKSFSNGNTIIPISQDSKIRLRSSLTVNCLIKVRRS